MTALVIFDLDGVLVDSEPIAARMWMRELARFGVTIDMAYFEANFLGRSFPKVVKAIREDLGLDLPADFEATYRTKLRDMFEVELTTTPGLAPVLARLAVPDCVATSSTPARAEKSLNITGLWPRFAGRVHTASEVAHGKPAPDLFLHVAALFDVAPGDCLVIEDSAPGLAAARAAGMPALHYAGGAHLNGRDVGAPASLGRIDAWSALPGLCPGPVRAGGGRMSRRGQDSTRLDDAARAGWLYYIAQNTQDQIAKNSACRASRPSVWSPWPCPKGW